MKTEKEKMILGEIYDPSDEQLRKERHFCKELCFDINQLRPSNVDKRRELLEQLLGTFQEDSWIEPTIMCDYGYNIHVGKAFYMNHNSMFLDCSPITFGDYVFVGPDCKFYTALHPLEANARDSYVEYSSPINIGSHVWFGGNVTVLPGVTIGDHVVIGAGSVVSKDIESYSLAVGNPCRKIRDIDRQESNNQ